MDLRERDFDVLPECSASPNWRSKVVAYLAGSKCTYFCKLWFTQKLMIELEPGRSTP